MTSMLNPLNTPAHVITSLKHCNCPFLDAVASLFRSYARLSVPSAQS